MTVGENLLQLRRQQNLSQEDLARKLLVSRQTISLWETNQSLPTIENLMRLKEIFGVSVDDMLREEEREMPVQTLCFSLNQEDIKASLRAAYKKSKRRGTITAIVSAFVIMIGWHLLSSLPALGGALFAGGCALLSGELSNIYSLNNRIKKEPVRQYDVRWDIFRDYMIVSYANNGRLTHQKLVEFEQIAKVWHHEDKLAILAESVLFTCPAEEIPDDSALAAAIREKTVIERKHNRLETWGRVLSWICLVTTAGMVVYSAVQSYTLGGAMELYMWYSIYLLPLPVVAIIMSLVLRHHKLSWKLLLCCGIISAFILGSATAGFFSSAMNSYDSDESMVYIQSVEEQLGIDFPDAEHVSMYTSGGTAAGNDQIFMLMRSYASYSGYGQKSINEMIRQDDRWSDSVPYELLPCIPLNALEPDADCFLLYDATTGHFNELPQSKGTHKMIYIAYHEDYGNMYIVEYEYACIANER